MDACGQSYKKSCPIPAADCYWPVGWRWPCGPGNRVCLACNSGVLGNAKIVMFECTALAPLSSRQQHPDLFTPRTDTMRSFFAQQDHLEVLNYIIDRLNFKDI